MKTRCSFAKSNFLLVIILFLTSLNAFAQEFSINESPLGAPTSPVMDYAGVMDAGAKQSLEKRIIDFSNGTNPKVELAVAIVRTTGERPIFEYSLAVARGWGIGPPAGQEGGGVLLLLATDDQKWRIQVTRSLEADLPDEVVGGIGSRMAPALREGRYAEAVKGCLDDLVRRLAERRGFSLKEDGLPPQTAPEVAPKTPARPNPADGRKPAPGGKP